MDGRRHRDAERRAHAAFRRGIWQRHRGLVVLYLLCGVGLVVVGLVKLFEPAGDRPAWLEWLYLAFLAGSFALFVMLIRRDDEPDA